MNNQPLVTVGIPAYNAERFIALAIKSVLAQTYTNFELIITDDGSTDRTVEIARSFNDPRINVLADGQNHGISYRLNQQIDLAKGKYFCRMDADDLMMPDRIEKQVKYLESNKDIDVIGGGAVIIDDDNIVLGKRQIQSPQILDLKTWSEGVTFIHPTIMGRILFFVTNKYSNALKGVEDVDLWRRGCQAFNLLILPDIYNFYREPLFFKLETYLFRGHQFRRLLKLSYVNKEISTRLLIKRLIGNYIRCATAILIHYIGLDSKLISRRNQPFEGSSFYLNILNSIQDS